MQIFKAKEKIKKKKEKEEKKIDFSIEVIFEY